MLDLNGALELYRAISTVFVDDEDRDKKAADCVADFRNACVASAADPEKFRAALGGDKYPEKIHIPSMKFFTTIAQVADFIKDRDGEEAAEKVVKQFCDIFDKAGTESEDEDSFARAFQDGLDELELF